MTENQPDQNNMRPGFCSATCVDNASLHQEIKKPELKTSDFFETCNLPKRFEHPPDIKHRRENKSAVCEYALGGPKHYIRFDNPKILATEQRFIPRMIREAIEIKKHPNFNRDEGWNIPPAWDPVISKIKSQSRSHTAKPKVTVSSFYWFNGYGCQVSKQHPFYRTSASVYGWYPPGIHSVTPVFFPAGQTFTNRLAAAGMYRNYSLNTGMDPVGY